VWGNFESRPFSQYVFMCYGREGFCGAPPAAATGTRMLDSIMHDPCEIISALAPDSVAAVGQSTPLLPECTAQLLFIGPHFVPNRDKKRCF